VTKKLTKKPLVAVVDDDESMRETMKDLLDSAGFSAVTFPSAESFLKSKRARIVSCLITDMRMPGMTGLELHRQLVASGTSVPTVLITAYPEERTREQALEEKVVCYLAKPFAADELLACIRSAIEGQPSDSKGLP